MRISDWSSDVCSSDLFIFPVRHDGDLGLQAQLRRQLIDAILDGRLSGSDPLPSCRRLAHSLGVSRNTVVLAYQALTDEGLLISRERIGYFVRSEEHTSELQSLMRISYAVFCLKKQKT